MKYTFLLKPLFFIFSLLFATWLVLYIEKISPSDFGKYEYIFNNETKLPPDTIRKARLLSLKLQQERMRKICTDYKAGLIDSTELNVQLEEFLKSAEDNSHK